MRAVWLAAAAWGVAGALGQDVCVPPDPLEDTEEWLVMVDSTGHETFGLGNYDHCLDYPGAQYCLLSAAGIMYGLCLPSECATLGALRNESNGLYNPFLTDQIPLLLLLVPDPSLGDLNLDCGDHVIPLGPGGALTLSVFGVLTLVALIATAAHAALRRKERHGVWHDPGCFERGVLALAGRGWCGSTKKRGGEWSKRRCCGRDDNDETERASQLRERLVGGSVKQVGRCVRFFRCFTLMCCGTTARLEEDPGPVRRPPSSASMAPLSDVDIDELTADISLLQESSINGATPAQGSAQPRSSDGEEYHPPDLVLTSSAWGRGSHAESMGSATSSERDEEDMVVGRNGGFALSAYDLEGLGSKPLPARGKRTIPPPRGLAPLGRSKTASATIRGPRVSGDGVEMAPPREIVQAIETPKADGARTPSQSEPKLIVEPGFLLAFSFERTCRRLGATSPNGRSWGGTWRSSVSAPAAVAGVRVLSMLLMIAADTLRATRHTGLSNPEDMQAALATWPAVLWTSVAECSGDVLLMAAGFLVALPSLRRVAIIRAMRQDAALRRLASNGRNSAGVCECCMSGGDDLDWTKRAARGCNAPGGLRSACFVLAHRALRLLPLTAAVLFFEWTVAPSLASGPMWGGWARLANECSKWGWSALLFAANVAPAGAEGGYAEHQCVASAWLLSVEMQLALVVLPIVLMTYKAHAALGLIVALGLLGAAVSGTAVVVGTFDLHLGPFVAPGEGMGSWGGSGSGAPLDTVDLYSVTPWGRGAGFIVGILLAMAWVAMEAGAEVSRRAAERGVEPVSTVAGIVVSAGTGVLPFRRGESVSNVFAPPGSSPRKRSSNRGGDTPTVGDSVQSKKNDPTLRRPWQNPCPAWSPWAMLFVAACFLALIAWGGMVRAQASLSESQASSFLPASSGDAAQARRVLQSSGSDATGWPRDSRASEVAFMVLSRPAAALAAALACLASFAGGGGAVRAVLEWPGWQPLARLTYGAILVEPVVLRTVFLSRTQWVRFGWVEFLLLWSGVVALTYALATALYMLVEGPVVAMEAAGFAWCGCAPPEELTLHSAREAAKKRKKHASDEEVGSHWWEQELGAAFLEDAVAPAPGTTAAGGETPTQPRGRPAPAAMDDEGSALLVPDDPSPWAVSRGVRLRM
jgi:peptidoglycan/LPS O-acetylase OafA/YrhL